MTNWTGLEDSFLFWTLIRTGSYTKAGLKLDIPKSQVSRRIIELERRMRKVLIIRNTRNIHLTEIGSEYYKSIDPIMREWNIVQENFQKETDPSIPIRIALTSDIASYFIPEVLKRFWKIFPDQKIELFENRNIINLAEERMDLAIRLENQKTSGTIRSLLGCLRIYLYASMKLKDKIHRKEIEKGNILSVGFHLPETIQNKIPKDHLFKQVLKLPHRIKVSEFSTALKFCVNGEGLLAMPNFLAEEGLADGSLCSPFPKDFLNFGPLEMVSLENRFLTKPLIHLMREIENFSKEWFY